MADTHQEIVKVWIAPGCIVCDSCENDCPEVFEVQEETCIIRPEAINSEFTKPLTPSIITAAEGCPVNVIKYETIEVAGPEPWAGKEQEAAAAGAAAGGGAATGGAKKAGWAPPSGPPDPKWAGLLSAARATGGKAAGAVSAATAAQAETATVEVPVNGDRPPAKAPVEAIVTALDPNAPPDAYSAMLVGTGYARPQPTVTQRIRDKAARAGTLTRRGVNMALVVGWGSIAAATATFLGALNAFMAPKISREPPATFRAGKLSEFMDPKVYEQHKDKNVWIVHLPEGKLVALSTICTHLGCIPNWLANDSKFKCPCHGSGFYMNGVNFEGPAPRPLERHRIYLEGDVLMVDKSQKYREELGQWTMPDSYLNV